MRRRSLRDPVTKKFIKGGSVMVDEFDKSTTANAEDAFLEAHPEPPLPPPPPEPEAPVDPSAYTSDGDLLDIWERRMLNPDLRLSLPIRVKIPGQHIRWINLTNAGRYQRARYEEGWVPVAKSELVDPREIYGVSYTVEGYVCRGERQGEMLMRIPEAVLKQIRRRRYDLVQQSNQKLKDTMINAAATDQVLAERAERSGVSHDQMVDSVSHFKGHVAFGTEAVPPEPGDLNSRETIK